MKPPPFTLTQPRTVAEALEALADQEDAKILAGGQSLVPLMAMRLTRWPDLATHNPLLAEMLPLVAHEAIRNPRRLLHACVLGDAVPGPGGVGDGRRR